MEALEIQTTRAGWRPWTIVKLAFVLAWCVLWYRQGGGLQSGGLNSIATTAGVGLGAVMFAMGVDHVYTTFRLRIDGDTVIAERRSLFRPRRWTCALADFRVGAIDIVKDGEGVGLGAHRFIALYVGSAVVWFMEGHTEERLEAVRAQLSAWTQPSRPAA